ncbi:MAG: sigma-70 family RNA polymerase sigma factor [Clostridia bacterium]|nr:sigma-70 family RNA polymerase sigma factor [Clostridia bacterium]
MSATEEKQKGEHNLGLIRKYQSGDNKALEMLIEENIGLVKNIAKRFYGRGTEYEDIVQIGTIGMIKAAKSFDESYNTVFSTYAVPLIIGEIRRFLRDDGIIKVSRDVRKKGSVILHAKEEFQKTHQRDPKISELSEICGYSEEEVVYALDASSPVSSLQESIGNDDNSATIEEMTASDTNEIETVIDNIALREAISHLPKTQQQIVHLRFFKELSQQETANILGLTQVKVSREEKKIFAFLRKEL